jgi:type II secretory pathway pseudopilin PulG
MKNIKGFTLMELLILILIVILFSTLAVPQLFETRKKANESSAVHSLRIIQIAQETYFRKHEIYANNYSSLYLDGKSIRKNLHMANWNQNKTQAKNGYFFVSNPFYFEKNFMVSAFPKTYDVTGNRIFFINAKGKIYFMEMNGALEDVAASCQSKDAWTPDKWEPLE